MDYIKEHGTISTTSITVCVMERQEEQKDTLMEVRVEKDCLEAAHRPKGSPAHRHGCLSCAVALSTVMGLVTLALVAGFILHFFMFTKASYNQDSRTSMAQEKFNITCEEKKRDEQRRYVIFTVTKTARYFIYGKVKNANSEELALMQTRNNYSVIIQKSRSEQDSDFIFSVTVGLNSGTKISIDLMSTNPDSCHFLFSEL